VKGDFVIDGKNLRITLKRCAVEIEMTFPGSYDAALFYDDLSQALRGGEAAIRLNVRPETRQASDRAPGWRWMRDVMRRR
jgi:hypothetical protein